MSKKKHQHLLILNQFVFMPTPPSPTPSKTIHKPCTPSANASPKRDCTPRSRNARAQRKLDTKQEAFPIALACSAAPKGHACWTTPLLANRLIESGVAKTISDEAVRHTLKKRAQAVAEASVSDF